MSCGNAPTNDFWMNPFVSNTKQNDSHSWENALKWAQWYPRCDLTQRDPSTCFTMMVCVALDFLKLQWNRQVFHLKKSLFTYITRIALTGSPKFTFKHIPFCIVIATFKYFIQIWYTNDLVFKFKRKYWYKDLFLHCHETSAWKENMGRFINDTQRTTQIFKRATEVKHGRTPALVLSEFCFKSGSQTQSFSGNISNNYHCFMLKSWTVVWESKYTPWKVVYCTYSIWTSVLSLKYTDLI